MTCQFMLENRVAWGELPCSGLCAWGSKRGAGPLSSKSYLKPRHVVRKAPACIHGQGGLQERQPGRDDSRGGFSGNILSAGPRGSSPRLCPSAPETTTRGRLRGGRKADGLKKKGVRGRPDLVRRPRIHAHGRVIQPPNIKLRANRAHPRLTIRKRGPWQP
jgi:hypothetical protein